MDVGVYGGYWARASKASLLQSVTSAKRHFCIHHVRVLVDIQGCPGRLESILAVRAAGDGRVVCVLRGAYEESCSAWCVLLRTAAIHVWCMSWRIQIAYSTWWP